MLDKSIPYFDIIMKREKNSKIIDYDLPVGYKIVFYQYGDEYEWAKIETLVGEFENEELALMHIRKVYFPHLDELKKRLMFIENIDGEKVATITCWWSLTLNEKKKNAIHWIAVKPSFQGLGLGKAIIFNGVKRMIYLEGNEDIYLHTQTWSYKAISIYLKAGFKYVKEGTLGTCKNDYLKAMEVLNNLKS